MVSTALVGLEEGGGSPFDGGTGLSKSRPVASWSYGFENSGALCFSKIVRSELRKLSP